MDWNRLRTWVEHLDVRVLLFAVGFSDDEAEEKILVPAWLASAACACLSFYSALLMDPRNAVDHPHQHPMHLSPLGFPLYRFLWLYLLCTWVPLV
jgi:hypothetical protein